MKAMTLIWDAPCASYRHGWDYGPVRRTAPLTVGEAIPGDGRGLRTVRLGGRVITRDESAAVFRAWLAGEEIDA